MDDYIYRSVTKLIKKYKTRDPFEILSAMGAVVFETSNYKSLKGYTFLSCRTVYVAVSDRLDDAQKRIVAAHELAHAVLHRDMLKIAPMGDSRIYDMTSRTEYEANLFAADLLISDEDIASLSADDDSDYFKLCGILRVSPELMSFKLFSLVKRGYSYNIPMTPDSRFLGRNFDPAHPTGQP